jgi:glycosyltransferase involved in cell wall biosynthesis
MQVMRIGIDYTAAVCQGAGIGRYTRELVRAVLAHDLHSEYRLFAAAGGEKSSFRPPLSLPGPTGHDPRERGPLAAAQAARVKVRLLPLSDRRMAMIWHELRLPIPVELFTGRVDVFHAPDFALPPVFQARTLLTIHDLSFLTHPETVHSHVRRYLQAAVPRSVARADHVLAVSEHTRRDLMSWLGVPAERVSVVYHGVDQRFYRVTEPDHLAAVRARYALPRRFILHVGTLQPRKNLVRLIEAYAALIGEGGASEGQRRLADEPPALVLAGGKGWLCGDIFEAVRRLRLEGQVHFPGFVDEADLPALYSLAELFVYPSLYEGFGLPVLEAMACGTPVVCSNAASLPEVAGEAALLVPPGDAGRLVAAMHFALTDTGVRARLVAAGLTQARRFTWEEAARRTVEVYRWLAGVEKRSHEA